MCILRLSRDQIVAGDFGAVERFFVHLVEVFQNAFAGT